LSVIAVSGSRLPMFCIAKFSKLTVRLHIGNSLVVCAWGQKWPKLRA